MLASMSQPKIRLLRCDTCRTLEELPDYDGPPEYDVLLEALLVRHRTNGHPHIGRLIDVEQRLWDLPNARKSIIEQIWGVSRGLAEFDESFYDTRDTFKEDALTCYQLHLRPTEGCHEWRSDRKRLLPDTKADRKEVGLSMQGAPVRFLCDFCPARAHYENKHNQATGTSN